MQIRLNQQNLKFLVFFSFTIIGLLVIFTATSLTKQDSQATKVFADDPNFKTIFQESVNTEVEVVDINNQENVVDASEAVLGAGTCSELRKPIAKGGVPARDHSPDCGVTGTSLPYKAPIGGGGSDGGGGYSGGEITIVYDVCVRDVCIPLETLAGTYNCANESCPMYVDDDGNAYLKKPDAARTFNLFSNMTTAPTEQSYEVIDSATSRSESKTSTYGSTVSSGELIDTDMAEITWQPQELNYFGFQKDVNQGYPGDTGKILSPHPTNDLAANIVDSISAPGLWNDGRKYDKQDACTQYKPANNTVLDTTNKTDKCYLSHIKQRICERRSVTVNVGEITKCVDEALRGYEQQVDNYYAENPDGTSPPRRPSNADCKKSVDIQLRTTGYFGNSFDTTGTNGGRTQVAIDAMRSTYRHPGNIQEALDGTVDFNSVTPGDNPLASTMWITNATVDVNVLNVAGIPVNIWFYKIKTTALWPDSTIDWNYESQEVTSIPNSDDIIDRECYNEALEKFYSARDYAACSI